MTIEHRKEEITTILNDVLKKHRGIVIMANHVALMSADDWVTDDTKKAAEQNYQEICREITNHALDALLNL